MVEDSSCVSVFCFGEHSTRLVDLGSNKIILHFKHLQRMPIDKGFVFPLKLTGASVSNVPVQNSGCRSVILHLIKLT